MRHTSPQVPGLRLPLPDSGRRSLSPLLWLYVLFGRATTQMGAFFIVVAGIAPAVVATALASSGASSPPLPPVMVVGVFPLLGIGLMAYGLYKGARALRLLRYGVPATERFVAREPFNIHVRGRPVVRLRFAFQVKDAAFEAIATTNAPERLLDEAKEPLLYDPVSPANAMLLDDLPGSPRVRDDGTVTSGALLKAVTAPVMPLAAAGMLGYLAWLLLL